MFECLIGSRALTGFADEYVRLYAPQKFTKDYSKKCVKTLHLGQEIFFKETKKKNIYNKNNSQSRAEWEGKQEGILACLLAWSNVKKWKTTQRENISI